MSNPELIGKLETLLSPVAINEGCIVYDIEFGGTGAGRTLRIFIDKEDPAVGVSIDDCSNVSRAVNEVLDAADPIPGGAYNLEVSTPGLDRVLRKPWHFQRVVGKKVWVKTASSFETMGLTAKRLLTAKQISDVLVAADEVGATFDVDGESFKIPYEKMEKAKLVFEMTKAQKPGHNKKKN